MPTKLISNRTLREFAALHPDAEQPLQDFRRNLERGRFGSFSALRSMFGSVDKVGSVCVFNIGGNKYRLVAAVDFVRQRVFVKAVMTHREYDKEAWK